MKTFAPIALDARILAQELDDLEEFLRNGAHGKEREHTGPFFKARRHLVAGLGLLHPDMGCFTYDGILDMLRRRILLASQPAA